MRAIFWGEALAGQQAGWWVRLLAATLADLAANLANSALGSLVVPEMEYLAGLGAFPLGFPEVVVQTYSAVLSGSRHGACLRVDWIAASITGMRTMARILLYT